jgi:putative membrane protein
LNGETIWQRPTVSQLLPLDRWNRVMLTAFLLLWGASCIRPPHPEYLLMQHGPTVVAIAALVAVQNRLAVSRISYTAILFFLTLHLLGARYLYTFVPYDDWLQPLLGFRSTDHFGFRRNHYDRFVHFMFGLLIVLPSWRFSRRILKLNGWWSAAVAFSIIMAASAMYEVIEWLVAVTQAEITAESYNGQQGDVWDPHWDMALAGAGALFGLALVAMIEPLRRPAAPR